MKRRSLCAFLSSISFSVVCFAQETDSSLDNLVEAYQFHKSRLQGDIEHLNEKLKVYEKHSWLPEEIQQRILLKKESLGALSGGSDEGSQAETMADILAEKGRSGVLEKRARVDSKGLALSNTPINSGLVNTKVAHVHRTELAELRRRIRYQSPSSADSWQKLKQAEILDQILSRREVLVDMDELGDLKNALPRGLFKAIRDNTASISRSVLSVNDIEALSGSEWLSKVRELGEMFASDIIAEIYENPNEVSKSWLREAGLKAIEPLSKKEIAVQLKRQKVLLSEEDKALSHDERRDSWVKAKSKISKIYHSPAFRNLEMEAQSEARERGLEYRSSFLNEINGIADREVHVDGRETELTQYFGKARLQGHTNACTSFALLDSMEWLGAPRLSTAYAHSLTTAASFLADEDLTQFPSRLSFNFSRLVNKSGDELIQRMDTPSSDPFTFLKALSLGIPRESAHPFHQKKWLVEDLNAVKGRVHSLSSLRYTNDPLSLEEIKSIIKQGMILPINIKYSDRTILEDWIQPEPSAGIGHSLIIAGYGHGSSPFDSAKDEPNGKDYFVVRDSFGEREIHYNISVDELLPIIEVYFSLGKSGCYRKRLGSMKLT